jgi:glycosyltransferase involved in cell wall biosynthesis
MTSSLRIGLYDRALATLGGGERFALSVAEYLARRHAVTLITHRSTDRNAAEARMGLDLSRVTFLAIPELSTAAMASVTSGFDLFIGSSHGECVPCRAALGVLVVFFPQVASGESAAMRVRRRLKLLARGALMQPTFESGVFTTRAEGGNQVRVLGDQTIASLPPSRGGYQTEFQLSSLSPKVAGAALALNDQQAGFVQLPADGSPVPCRLTVPAAGPSSRPRLTITAQEAAAGNASSAKLSLTGFHIESARYRLYEAILQTRLPALGLSLQYVPPEPPPLLPAVRSYQAVWTTSRFSQDWIGRRWRRESSVIYPPVDTGRLLPGPKKNRILTVGRFFAGQHNKKHSLMVRAFREMVDAGLSGWELHLAGGSMAGEVHRRYLAGLRALAQGYPVFIHADADTGRLSQLYGESAIYWHASGYGEDDQRHPERFEHFGITTVEAMAAGCVPVVIGKGGQPEIVQDGRNGLLWLTLAELKASTWRLVHDEGLRRQLAAVAREDSLRFGQPRFEAELGALLGQIGVE